MKITKKININVKRKKNEIEDLKELNHRVVSSEKTLHKTSVHKSPSEKELAYTSEEEAIIAPKVRPMSTTPETKEIPRVAEYEELKKAKKGNIIKRIFSKIFTKRNAIIFLILAIIGFLAFAYYRINSMGQRIERFDENGNQVEACTNILNPDCWTEAFKPQLIQTNGFTNILVLGVDTRENGSLMNTDSIIIASYNHDTKKTMMISIPRDLYSFKYQTKISAVYAYTHKKDSNDPYKYFKEELTNVTGLKIHYVTTIKFNGVIDLIDNVGGIEVCPYINKEFVAKYPNPDAKTGRDVQWLYYTFPKGCQTLDGKMGLVYARFRHIRSGPGALASDFSRARRQQEVINAIKDKLLAEDLSLNERVENWWQLLQTLNSNITYSFTFEDFLAGLSIVDQADMKPIQLVLDPTFGGMNKLIYTVSNDQIGYTIQSRDKDFAGIKAEIQKIIKNGDFYKETPKILVMNQTGAKLPSTNAVYNIKNNNSYYAMFKEVTAAANEQITTVKIFDFTAGTKPGSLEIIKSTLGVSEVELLPETYGITRSKDQEDFLIVIPSEVKPSTTPAN